MKQILFSVLLSIYCLSAQEIIRPKVGLVLSGGGAKGFAHVATLKMIDSLQIPVDYIAGTSMGGIVGALYSIGYSGEDLEKLAHTTDWQEIFTDSPSRDVLPYFQKKDVGRYQVEFGLKGYTPVIPSGLINGQKISLLFSRLTSSYQHISDFDKLPIPLRCVTVDLITGKEAVLSHGSLSAAMRATMSIPSAFVPVEWGDSLLVDGGVLNNLPADVVREMGADVIIAVNVTAPLKHKDELEDIVDIFDQSFSVPGVQKTIANMTLADVLISPEVADYTAADFGPEQLDIIMQRGRKAVREKLSELVQLQNKFGLYRTDIEKQVFNDNDTHTLSYLVVHGNYRPIHELEQMLNLYPGHLVSMDSLKSRAKSLSRKGLFEKIDILEKTGSGDSIGIVLTVKERTRPVIHGVQVSGNTTLPFNFIYNLLGIHPGDVFDPDLLEKRITEIYSLGYFDLLYYETQPIGQNKIRLILRMKEKPVRKLRLGLRYDDLHKLVLALSIQGTNILIPGLRLENELQIAGLTRFELKAFYPSRTLDFPVYPFIHGLYRDVPVNIYSVQAAKIASFRDRSLSYGMGIGLLFSKSWLIESEYAIEHVFIRPDVALSETERIYKISDTLRRFTIASTFDVMDDLQIPRNGSILKINYDAGFRSLGSSVDYSRYDVCWKLYATPLQKHTLGLSAFYGKGNKTIPLYKAYFIGGPDSFIGLNYTQLIVSRTGIGRLEYRYEYKKDIFLEGIYNFAIEISSYFPQPGKTKSTLNGFGVGIKFLSLIGPLEIIYARGDRSLRNNNANQTVFYFLAGFYF